MLGFIKRLFGPKVDIQQLLNDGAVVVDVRSKSEFASGHGKGAKNIPLDQIGASAEKIKGWNKPVLTVCASGMRSGMAAGILRKSGIEVHNAGPWTNAR